MNRNEVKGNITKVVDIKRNFKITNIYRRNLDSCFTFGGIFSDFELAWLYSGPVLKIVNIADGVLQACWDFSSITRDQNAEITSAIEYPVSEYSNKTSIKENQTCLIVGYNVKDSNKPSYISFCHPRTSRILHTVIIKEKITCMSLITPRKDHSCPFGGFVKLMSGSLAIGTKSGNLLILDIKNYDLITEMYSCIRRSKSSDSQNRISDVLVLNTKHHNENEIKEKICNIDNDNYHVAISLSVSDRKESHQYDIEVCALTYITEGATLAVGFKSGVFQLWDICTLKIVYKSSQLRVPTPIVRISFQEPCNDPQNFCYLWVVHQAGKDEAACLPFAMMYGVLYRKVSTVPEYGRYYKTFMHCKKRFDLDMDLERCLNGRCITCSVVSNTPSNMLRHITQNEYDPSKINLFTMVFETWERETDLHSRISLVVFDMNQWYKAQMPHQCYHGFSVPFIHFITLDSVSERKSVILDMRIRKDTIQQFLTFNLSEDYSYPSSLSFDTLFLTDTKVIHLRVPGTQKNVLEKIVSEGPSCLISPSKYFTDCKEANLGPCFSDSYNHITVPTQIQQRNFILTILLENKMSAFLVRCVKQWADGSRAVSGCTLPNLIHWAWDCVTRIKKLTDIICVPLFDYSGDDLDRENYQKLKHCCQLLHVVRDLLMYILKNYQQFLLDDANLNHQIETLKLVTKYFDVVIWCLDCSLLPEKVASSTDRCVPTYMMSLLQYTDQRREELKIVATKDKYFLTDNSTLYIVDSVLENENGGKKLRQVWERESYGTTEGSYPPVTLQSLLRMFLMPDLSTETKHFIMIYFLLDVCDYHRDEEMKEQLLSFAIVFSVDTKFFSLVEACWLLDHEKFEEAAELLFSNSVIIQLRNKPQLYKTMLLACVCQGQYALALKCERVVRLSLSVFNDGSVYLTILLLNGLVMEAYTGLKNNCCDQKGLLKHFFKVCDELGLLKELFKFPLTIEEEEEFMSYLGECTNKNAGDLKVMYLLSRARYVEAIELNHNLGTVVPKVAIVGENTTKQESGTGRTTTRDLLVNAFSKTLPGVTNELIAFCRKEKDKLYRWKQVKRPTPLSVVVHTDTTQQMPTYKSSFESVLRAAITKTAETWADFPSVDKSKHFDSLLKNTPFLRSNIATPRSRKSNVSFASGDIIKVNANSERSKKPDKDEPPFKRQRKTDFEQSIRGSEDADERDDEPRVPLEISKILHTPHIQKRLNKLLRNTPETSPLTSILKSSEVSRFKQPPKVGFSVPEERRKSSSRKSTFDAETDASMLAAGTTDRTKHVQKSLVRDFEQFSPAQQTKRENNVSPEKRNPAVTSRSDLSFAGSASDTSEKQDSYYSLESANESISDIIELKFDETVVEEESTYSRAGNRRNATLIVESMSDDDMPTRYMLECMSDEEAPAARIPCPSAATEHSTREEAISSRKFFNVTQSESPVCTVDQEREQQRKISFAAAAAVTIDMDAESATEDEQQYRPDTKRVRTADAAAVEYRHELPRTSKPVTQEIEKMETTTTRIDDDGANENDVATRQYRPETPLRVTDDDHDERQECVSLSASKSVVLNEANDYVSKTATPASYWSGAYDRRLESDTYFSVENQFTASTAPAPAIFGNAAARTGEANYSVDEFSDDAECIRDDEEHGDVVTVESNDDDEDDDHDRNENQRSNERNAVTEMKKSPLPLSDDSDIEIVDDDENQNETVGAPTTDSKRYPKALEDVTTEEDENDRDDEQNSEKTYESDYDYSHGSVEAESYVEENSILEDEVDDENVLTEEEGSSQVVEVDDDDTDDDEIAEEEGEEEEDEEREVSEVDDEEDIEDEEEEVEEEEDEQEDEELEEEEEMGEQEGERRNSHESRKKRKMSFEVNAQIDYEELRNIMSNIHGIQNVRTVTVDKTQQTENRTSSSKNATGDFKIPIISAVCSLNDTAELMNASSQQISVCEVFGDETPSVIEETVQLDYSDTTTACKTNATETILGDDRNREIRTSNAGEERHDSSKEIYNLDSDDDDEAVFVTRNKDDADESNENVSSVSNEKCANNDTESEEPQMVFYFGENSVTSIGDDVLPDEKPSEDEDGDIDDGVNATTCSNVEIIDVSVTAARSDRSRETTSIGDDVLPDEKLSEDDGGDVDDGVNATTCSNVEIVDVSVTAARSDRSRETTSIDDDVRTPDEKPRDDVDEIGNGANATTMGSDVEMIDVSASRYDGSRETKSIGDDVPTPDEKSRGDIDEIGGDVNATTIGSDVEMIDVSVTTARYDGSRETTSIGDDVPTPDEKSRGDVDEIGNCANATTVGSDVEMVDVSVTASRYDGSRETASIRSNNGDRRTSGGSTPSSGGNDVADNKISPTEDENYVVDDDCLTATMPERDVHYIEKRENNATSRVCDVDVDENKIATAAKIQTETSAVTRTTNEDSSPVNLVAPSLSSQITYDTASFADKVSPPRIPTPARDEHESPIDREASAVPTSDCRATQQSPQPVAESASVENTATPDHLSTAVTYSPRRFSKRIARRRGVESIVGDAADDDDDDAAEEKKLTSRNKGAYSSAAGTRRHSTRLSGKKESEDVDKSEDSSAESASSKTSTNSRRSTRSQQRKSYTSMEVRKSSRKHYFKPLTVIQSDDEQSFHQPVTPSKEVVEEDSMLSSAESTQSKTSSRRGGNTRRSTKKADSLASEKRSSGISRTSNTTPTTSRRKASEDVDKSEGSSAESASSKTSTNSRRSTRSQQRKSYTSMEVRKSSLKHYFKPLTVIQSDDEQSFHQPVTPSKEVVEEDSMLSSAESTQSKQSRRGGNTRRSTKKADSLASEKGSSGISDTSNTTPTSRRRTRLWAKEETEPANQQDKTQPQQTTTESSNSVNTYTSSRRLTRHQKSMMEQTLKESPRKKK